MESCATEQEMHANFMATLERGYTPINGLLDKYIGQTASLVGSGPSIRETYKELTGDVFAINSSIAFLLSVGVVPKFAMMWDAAEIVEKFAVPHPDITYLVGSRCHPKVFERLKDCKVIVWHAGGDHDIYEVMQRPDVAEKQGISEPLINGGSAGITRGIYVVNALGYRDIHLFGADSSYLGDATHVTGSLVPEKDMLISVGFNPGRVFRTTPEWCAQVQEYQSIFTLFTHKDFCKLSVHGEGMLPYMHELLVAKKALQGEDKFYEEMRKQEEETRKINEQASLPSEDINHLMEKTA